MRFKADFKLNKITHGVEFRLTWYTFYNVGGSYNTFSVWEFTKFYEIFFFNFIGNWAKQIVSILVFLLKLPILVHCAFCSAIHKEILFLKWIIKAVIFSSSSSVASYFFGHECMQNWWNQEKHNIWKKWKIQQQQTNIKPLWWEAVALPISVFLITFSYPKKL